ncbi:hypothetical protein, partial [Pseudomonas costantinii]|uniref:hypothetical protein n=1 Tax=Pseudomonas costantinii TaxID=168469 RepID=UPI001C435604
SKAEHGGLKADLSGVKQKPDQEQSDIYLVNGDPNVGLLACFTAFDLHHSGRLSGRRAVDFDLRRPINHAGRK